MITHKINIQAGILLCQGYAPETRCTNRT